MNPLNIREKIKDKTAQLSAENAAKVAGKKSAKSVNNSVKSLREQTCMESESKRYYTPLSQSTHWDPTGPDHMEQLHIEWY